CKSAGWKRWRGGGRNNSARGAAVPLLIGEVHEFVPVEFPQVVLADVHVETAVAGDELLAAAGHLIAADCRLSEERVDRGRRGHRLVTPARVGPQILGPPGH